MTAHFPNLQFLRGRNLNRRDGPGDSWQEASFQNISLDQAKLARLTPKLYAPELEQTLIAFATGFKLKPKEGYTSEFFLLTHVAIYLFKFKLLGSPDLTARINVLRICGIFIHAKEVAIDIHQSPSITVKTTEGLNITLCN
jgi:hypothetical protein